MLNTSRPITAFWLSGAILSGVLVLSASIPESQIDARNPTTLTHAVAPVRTAQIRSRTRKKRIPYLASVGGTRSTLLAIADQPSFTQRHRFLADAVLRRLPPHCRTHLRHFSILYGTAKQRGLGGATTIILDGTVSDEEFVSLLVHECGHVTHGNLLGSKGGTPSAFRDGDDVFATDSEAAAFFSISWSAARTLKQDVASDDFISGYAASDAFEDFAEFFAAYVLHLPMVEERAQTNANIATKLAWMKEYLPLPAAPFGESTFTWKGSIPWDITKLPYRPALLLATNQGPGR